MAIAKLKRNRKRAKGDGVNKEAVKERYDELVRDKALDNIDPDPEELFAMHVMIGATTKAFLTDVREAIDSRVADLQDQIGDLQGEWDELENRSDVIDRQLAVLV